MRSILPSPALIVACLALLAALGGSSLASRQSSAVVGQVGVIHVQSLAIDGTSRGNGTARCPRGRRATGGGAYLEGAGSFADHIIDSEPAVTTLDNFRPKLEGTATNWHVTYYNSSGETRRLDVFVICTG